MPGNTKILLSVGSLIDHQKTHVFKFGGCFVIDNITLRVEAIACRENNKGLYRLQVDSPDPSPKINSLHLRSQAVLLHKRLRHFHARGMQRMITFKAVRGMPYLQISTQIYSMCQLGKHAKTNIPKEATHHASRILELAHSDVCGPFKISSTGGAKYFVTFVDNFSRKRWIYFISQKSQVLAKCQHFVQLTTNSTAQIIQTLRTYNGREYTLKADQELCSSKGIARELTPPHTTK